MTFDWHGVELDLLDHPYNATATNERAVEVPVAWEWAREHARDRGLEFGNVLSHYGPLPSRRIVDRYEEAPDVENLDLFSVGGSYDWIVSVSTVEHVRADELPRNPFGGVAALMHLVGLLAPGGHMLVTVGLGQNEMLDALLTGPYRWPGAPARATTVVRDHLRSGLPWVRTDPPTWAPYTEWTPDRPNTANSVWIGEW